MKTKPWTKHTAKDAMLDLCLKIRSGIIGYLASFHSFRKKRTTKTAPNTKRQTTVAEDQGKLTPPYVRPSRNITVPAVIVMTPIQSMALRPDMMAVFGVSMSRKKRMMANAIASKGTRRVSVEG